jgi:holo-[acyl-carrier protein] synthase
MKIFGIGTDIINISRIRKSLKNKRFINKIFNYKETIKCKNIVNQENCFAKRFAAKEAFVKALGTGISNGINFKEIIIYNTQSGKPYIKLLGNTKKVANKIIKKKKYNIFLSISDDKPFAVALVIITL